MSTPRKKKMAELFARAGLNLSAGQTEKFWSYYLLLEKYNEELDLSRLTRFDDIIIKHFIDCAYVGGLCEIPSPVVDIGSGAGFPGIPLKIMNPDIEVILAEPRHKRVAFLRMVIEELGLTGISVYPHLVTELSFFDAQGVITRALESVEETAGRVSHFLPESGKIIFMKGPAAGAEIMDMSQNVLKNFAVITDREYTLPGTPFMRRLVVLEKISSERKITYRILTREEKSAGTVITSADNTTFKEIKKLTSVDGIRKAGKTIVSGEKQVLEAAARLRTSCVHMVIFDGYAEDNDSMNRRIGEFSKEGSLLLLKKALYNELDIFKTNAPLLVVTTPLLEEWDVSPSRGCTLLVPFQDPQNVGALIRSAAGFGVERIVLLKEAAHPFHPKSIRASGGAVFGAPLMRGPSLDELEGLCAGHSLALVTLDAHGEPIGSFTFPESFLLLPGVEGPGLPESLRGRAVSIPISGDIESLNAAIAASIALYAWKTSRKDT